MTRNRTRRLLRRRPVGSGWLTRVRKWGLLRYGARRLSAGRGGNLAMSKSSARRRRHGVQRGRARTALTRMVTRTCWSAWMRCPRAHRPPTPVSSGECGCQRIEPGGVRADLGHCRRPAGDIKPGKRVLQMLAHGVGRQAEPPRDRDVVVAGGDKAKQLTLTTGEQTSGRVAALAAQRVGDVRLQQDGR